MCFGPEASFSASAILGAVGTATLRNIRWKRELVFALIPVVFAVQQLIEGMLWLILGTGEFRHLEYGLTLFYLFIAYTFWPIFTPLSVYVMEPEAKRKKMILPFCVLGVAISLYLLFFIAKDPVQANTVCHSLHYQTTVIGYHPLIFICATVICAPFLCSSYRPLVIFAFILMISCGVSYYFYYTTFDSVWCFFAAIISANIYFFLRWLHRQPDNT